MDIQVNCEKPELLPSNVKFTTMADCDNKTWSDYVPDRAYLYEVGQGENLDNSVKEIQECLSSNSLCPLTEMIYDWWDYPEGYYMDEIYREMESDGLEDEFREHQDEILELLRERDASTPVDDLLGASGPFPMFYSLGESFSDLWCYGKCDEAQALEDIDYICELLNIPKDSPQAKKIRTIRFESNYGGELRIYFHTDLQRMLTYDEKNDFKAIRFKGKFMVALWDRSNGAGYEQEIELDLTVQFERSNLYHAEYEKYDIISTCGLCRDAIPETDPEMLKEMPEETKEVKSSTNPEYLAREAHLNEVFKSGKCTLGDMDMDRHRDIEYRNEIPCGWKCPHCGTFWID